MERFLGCNACQASFNTPEEHKAYNLKRKIGEMGFVTEEEFNRRKAAALLMEDESVPNSGVHHCKYCKYINKLIFVNSKTFSSKNAEESHLKSKKHKFNVKLSEKKKASETIEPTADAENTMEVIEGEEPEKTETEKNVIPDKHEYELNECFFCNNMSENIEGNLEHMLKIHGFFIPEAEYLVNIEGLLKYIGTRIGDEHVCLTCQMMFKTVNALKDHMVSKCHCKLLWDDDVDVGEYEEFFDFTKNDKDDEDDTPLDPAVVDANGELRLPNGNILGNRIYKRYYKQYYKPVDNRPSVVANKLLLLYQQNHIDTNTTLAKTDYRIQQIVRRHKKMDIDGFVNYNDQKLKVGVRTNKLNRKYYRSQTG